jgi:hypothetical protein
MTQDPGQTADHSQGALQRSTILPALLIVTVQRVNKEKILPNRHERCFFIQPIALFSVIMN